MRPRSIVRFEQFYLASVAVGVANTALAAGMVEALVPASADVRGIGTSLLVGGTLVSLAVSLVLWFFIARMGSNIARWLLVVLVVVGVALGMSSLLSGRYPTGLLGAMSAANSALQVLAIWCLFRPDTAEWFRSPDDGDDDEARFE